MFSFSKQKWVPSVHSPQTKSSKTATGIFWHCKALLDICVISCCFDAPTAHKPSTSSVSYLFRHELDTAFKKSNEALATSTMLVYPCDETSISLKIDASDVGVGAVLEQFNGGFWETLVFFSRQLHTPECEYSVFADEQLALYLAVRHFHFFFEVCSVIYSLHKSQSTHTLYLLRFFIHVLLTHSDTYLTSQNSLQM